jgi:hypothetical protein
VIPLKCTLIADDLVKTVTEGSPLPVTVQSCFEHAFNLITQDGSLVSGVLESKGIGPNGFSLAAECSSGWPFELGDNLVLTDKGLYKKSGQTLIDFNHACIWHASPASNNAPVNHQRGAAIALLSKALLNSEYGVFTPLLPILDSGFPNREANPYSAFASPHLQKLIPALAAKDWHGAARIAENFIGLGPGLTPSGDDFLAAVMASLYYWAALMDRQFLGYEAFNQQLVDASRSRTTLLSAEMLRHAANGKLPERHRQVLLALIYDSEVRLSKRIADVLQVGANSGADFLFGLILVEHTFFRPETQKTTAQRDLEKEESR